MSSPVFESLTVTLLSVADESVDVFERQVLASRAVVVATVRIPSQFDPQSVGRLWFVIHVLCIRKKDAS